MFVVFGRFNDDITILDFDVNPSDSRPSQLRPRENSGQYFLMLPQLVHREHVHACTAETASISRFYLEFVLCLLGSDPKCS